MAGEGNQSSDGVNTDGNLKEIRRKNEGKDCAVSFFQDCRDCWNTKLSFRLIAEILEKNE